MPVGTGRWLNDEDNTEHRRVAVVGWELLKNVFPGRPAVGATMLLNGIRFDVIGVLAKVGKDGNNGTNARIFVPVETMRNLFPLKQQNSEERAFLHQLPPAEQSRAPAVQRGDSPDHRAPPRLRSQAGRCLRRLGHHRELAARGQDLRRHGLFPRGGGIRDPGAGRDRHRQHHAGLGGRAHPGNRPAQSAGRHLSEIS